MIYMITLSTCGCHNRGIGNRRAVITTYCAGHAGGDGDDHQFMIGTLEYRYYDGNQDTESTP